MNYGGHMWKWTRYLADMDGDIRNGITKVQTSVIFC